MDTSDPLIQFNEQGQCNHCSRVEAELPSLWHPNEYGAQKLQETIAQIKADQKSEYDCIIGLSGGVDSSYLCYIAKEKLGLNPLAVHVDGGWNSDEAVSNIQNITAKLNVDLYTIVVNWEEMRDLQLSFLKASVPNQDIPQDHAFFAGLYNYATKYNIRYVLSGSNFATESILPPAWGFDALDAMHINAIQKQFGTVALKTFPLVSFFRYKLYYPLIKRMEVVKPLNLMDYNKTGAMKLLMEKFSWQYYGGKHYESRFTKFFQSYYLPVKFGYDKRRAHLSSILMNGEITRDEALQSMEELPYNPETIHSDIEFVAKKLGITHAELETLIALPNAKHTDYHSNIASKKTLMKLIRIANNLRGK